MTKTAYFPKFNEPVALYGQILLSADGNDSYVRQLMSDNTTRIFHVLNNRQERVESLPDDTYPVGKSFSYQGLGQR